MINLDRRGGLICGVFIDAINWEDALARISLWAAEKKSCYVCVSNVHSVVTASRKANFLKTVNQADMATPDGMPLVWVLRHYGFSEQPRISGPDLLWNYCAVASARRERIFLYGNTERTLALLKANISRKFPDLTVAGALSPPFRTLTDEEDRKVVETINASGAGVVFVSLGCPKQEMWMAKHRGRIHAVMIGVGAAFDFHAGTILRAPQWMQKAGLEWLFRLLCDPRRLWKRYIVTNTLFIFGIVRQLFFQRRSS